MTLECSHEVLVKIVTWGVLTQIANWSIDKCKNFSKNVIFGVK